VATVATEYVGDPRFGGPAAAPAVNLSAPVPTPTAPPAGSTARLRPGTSRPTSHVVAAGIAAIVLLIGAVLVGKTVLGGSGDSGDGTGVPGGLLTNDNPRVAAMKADVQSIAVEEENFFTGTQTFAAAKAAKGAVVVGGHSVRLSSADETVQVVLSPSGTGYCIRASRAPAGGGNPQVVVYVSTQGGLQPPAVTSCPAAF
jgi:hypothetical protein